MFQAFCPRCDRKYIADTQAGALALVREHLVRAEGSEYDDGLHDDAVLQWDDEEDPV